MQTPSAPYGTVLADAYGTILSIEPTLAACFGYQPAELLGYSLNHLFPDLQLGQDFRRPNFLVARPRSGPPLEACVSLIKHQFRGSPLLLCLVLEVNEHTVAEETEDFSFLNYEPPAAELADP